MNRIFIFLLSLLLLAACTDKKIVRPSDYMGFLADDNRTGKQVKRVNEEIGFWQKRLSADTGNYVDMTELANQHLKRFKLSGFVSDLHIADSFFKKSLTKIKNGEPDIYFALSQNAIAQHRFSDAWKHLADADSAGADPWTGRLLRFDAGMEIGLYQQASQNLNRLKNKKGFDYLIRKAKLEDHYGNPDNAIELMEQALKEADKSGKESLILWTKSNLADMYGHAGRVKDAYRFYLDVLKKDSSYLYALKGIAWVAWSHDHNAEDAKRILYYILSQTNMPDLYLMLAEIAGWEGDEEMKRQNITTFLTEVRQPEYGDMYNKYLISLYAEELKDYDKSLALAMKEVKNRPTPETYDWLAWVYFQKGEVSKAYELIKNYVLGRTFEPDAQLHAAYILKAAGKKKEAKRLFNECAEAGFELGPVTLKQVEKEIEAL
jgi:tetratricopeptide (TPR) repeat protein